MINQKSVEFFLRKMHDTSLSEFEEAYEIANKEDNLKLKMLIFRNKEKKRMRRMMNFVLEYSLVMKRLRI